MQGTLLTRSFFEHQPEIVAPRLLGKILVRKVEARSAMAGRIVEVEAYLGPHNNPPDPAAHSHRGPTPRNSVLFGHAGHAYVYSIYGQYFCLNVSCEVKGSAGCVLIRALEPIAGLEQMAANRGFSLMAEPARRHLGHLTSGPSRLCQALAITRVIHNGLDVTESASPLQIVDDGFLVTEALVTPRIGIKHAVEWPLRFTLPENPFVSGPKNLPGTLVQIP